MPNKSQVIKVFVLKGRFEVDLHSQKYYKLTFCRSELIEYFLELSHLNLLNNYVFIFIKF